MTEYQRQIVRMYITACLAGPTAGAVTLVAEASKVPTGGRLPAMAWLLAAAQAIIALGGALTTAYMRAPTPPPSSS